MSNGFAPIVPARPNPIFGRPVHPGSPPIDSSPILLLKPFGFQIAPDTLSSDEKLVGQRGITPAFGYSAPHPSAGGTLTLLIHALPSAHYGSFRPSPLRWYSRLTVFAACASPLASGDWFLQFRAKACIRFTPPLRRSPSAQSSGT